jgi:hypothetical protein
MPHTDPRFPDPKFPGYLRTDYPTVRAEPDRPVELNGYRHEPEDARAIARALLAAADISEEARTGG